MPTSLRAALTAVRRSYALRLGLWFGTLAGLVATVGGIYHRSERASLRQSIWRELETIADFKARQLAEWRSERLSDARFLMRTPAVAQDVAALLADPDSAAARAAVVNWLQPMKGGERYDSILLVDRQMNVPLRIPDDSPPPGPPLRGSLTSVFATGQLTLTDLHRVEPAEPIHMDLLAPISAPDHGPRTPADPPAAAPLPLMATIVLRLNPERYLFPLLQSWPSTSASAETMIVRREGDEVVYLNELRHRRGAALTIRRPLDEPTLPAAMGARGEIGVREGVDYRGVPVLAAVRLVPDSPWVLVAKIDQEEAYAPVRDKATSVALIVAVLLAMLGGAAAYLWRLQHEQVLRRSLAAEQEARRLAERLALVTRHASDIMLLADDGYRILEANESALTAYGYTLQELQERRVNDLRPPEARESFAPDIARVRSTGGACFETLQQRKDGTVFPVEVNSRFVELDGQTCLLAVVRDTTDRRRAEAELRRVNRALRTISECNQVLVRASNEPELLQRVCRLVVEFGGYRMAWVGYAADDAARAIRPVAQEGFASGGLDEVKTSWADNAMERGPAGTCVRTGELAVCRYISTDPRFAQWREEALRRGFASMIALPLNSAARTFGVLCLYSAAPDTFDEAEIRLLVELANDLAYGITALRSRAGQQRAEGALQASEERHRLIFEASPQPMWVYDVATLGFLEVNTAALRQYGYSRDEFRGMTLKDIRPPEDVPALLAVLDPQTARDHPPGPVRHRRKDGTIFFVEISSHPLLLDGRPVRLVLAVDLTERLEAGRTLGESEARYRSMFENSHATMLIIDPATGEIVDANPAACDFYGWTRAELQHKRIAEINVLPPAQVEAELARARATQRFHFLFSHRRADGTVREVEVFSGPIAIGGRELLYSIIHDISERRAAELALRGSEERLRLFIQHAPAALAMFDRAMRYIDVSRRWLTDYGLGDRPIRGCSHYDIFPEIGERWKEIHRRGLAGEVIRAEEDRFERADGTVQWLRWEVRPWCDTGGAVGGIVIFSEDITARKHAEAALAGQIQELQRWHAVTLGRETRVLELKREVNALLAASGRPERYASAAEPAGPTASSPTGTVGRDSGAASTGALP